MKLSYLLLSAFVIVITSCSSDADTFSGNWQSVDDPSKQIILTQSGKKYTLETRNIESSFSGMTGSYDEDQLALVFDNGKGDNLTLVYNDSLKQILGLGSAFEKSTNAVAENKESVEAEDMPAEDKPTETTPAEDNNVASNETNCAKGEILLITGNNVRVRNEPDLTKQNILFQVHKNYEVVRLGDKTVDGQKWYKVCYDGNIGWVSGQYAAKKK